MNSKLINKLVSIVSALSLLINSLGLPAVAYAQTATDSGTPVVEATPTPTETPTKTPTPTVEPTPTEELTPTPTEEVTPTPTEEPTPTVEATNTEQSSNQGGSQPSQDQNQSSTTPEVTVTPTVTTTPVEEKGVIQAVVVQNVAATSIELTSLNYNSDGTASITTDKLDYAPTDVVVITGKDFKASTEYDLEITGTGGFSFKDKVKSDESGALFYSYQLDGTYRPDYKIEIKSGGVVIASTTFTDTNSVTICHRTSSNSNPYNQKSPNIQNNGSLSNGHLDHTGPVYPAANWGDIIPPYRYGQFNYPGMNWTTQGQAIWNNRCNIPTTGTIVIVKDTDPHSSQDFNFTRSYGSSFSLEDGDSKTTSNLTPGSYTVTENSTAGWVLTDLTCVDPSQNTTVGGATANINLSAGETVTCTYTNTKKGSISGHKYNDINGDGNWDEDHPQHEPALEHWKIFIDANNNQIFNDGETFDWTDDDGDYRFSNLLPGTYDICEVQQTGWVNTDPGNICRTVNLSAGESEHDKDFGNHEQKGSISGHKFSDKNGDGIWNKELETYLTGWTFNLQKWNGEIWVTVATDVTDGNGDWSFDNLESGTYRVVEVQQSGWNPTTYLNGYGPFTVPSNITDVDFGNQELRLGLTLTKTNSVSGSTVTYTLTVTNTSNKPLSEVTVQDALPGGLNYISGTSTLSGSPIADPTVVGGALTWVIGTLGTGLESTAILNYQASIDTTTPGDYTNIARAYGWYGGLVNGILGTVAFVSDGQIQVGTKVESDPADSVITIAKSVGQGGQLLTTQVLGAATELPATGSGTALLIITLAAAVIGLGLKKGAKHAKR